MYNLFGGGGGGGGGLIRWYGVMSGVRWYWVVQINLNMTKAIVYILCIIQNSLWFATVFLLFLSVWHFCFSYFYIKKKIMSREVVRKEAHNDDEAASLLSSPSSSEADHEDEHNAKAKENPFTYT